MTFLRSAGGALALAAVTMAGLSARAGAQVKPADKPIFPAGTPVVNVPFADDNLNFQKLGSLHMRLSFNGGPDKRFQVDTGSTGIMVPASMIPNYQGKGEPGEITYSSSGVHLTGTWETVDVTFEDARMPDGSPVVAHMPVLAVTQKECLALGVNATKCSPGPWGGGMMGVGFGRGKDEDWNTQQRNPWLMLNAMQEGRMRRGYVITPKGVQLGLNAETISGDWKWQKLLPRTATVPSSYPGPKDWTTAAGTVEVKGTRLPMGTVLIDTGLTNMMLSSPGAPDSGDVPDGVPIKVWLLGGQLSYEFTTGGMHDPETPRKVSWRKPHETTFVNTGLRAIAHFDYCYDSDGGFLGLKFRP
ncbi:MAG: hypothetical protein PW792_14615 [Acidobacteriaceae bacterium]|nr:hypothetical protein [Acidobacteriaceae bacterium]